MSKVCEICLKSYLKSNLVKRGIGRRVVRRTLSRQEPNLFEKKLKIDGVNIKIKMCSSCLKRIKYERNLADKETQALVASKAAIT